MAKLNPETRWLKRRGFLGATVGGMTGLALVAGGATAEEGIPHQFYRGTIVDGEMDWEPGEVDLSFFDAEGFKVTGGGRVIHWELPLGDGKPYILSLESEEDLLYTQRGAVINFEADENDPLFPEPGRWRGVVREEVGINADDDGFSFERAITRVDIFSQRGMNPVGAVVLALGAFDEDRIDDYKAKAMPNPGGNVPGAQ